MNTNLPIPECLWRVWRGDFLWYSPLFRFRHTGWTIAIALTVQATRTRLKPS
ncbi:MAG TPA: hypothetical protein IGR89_09410 [Oscillatoriaceae cyanobacterium M7585_C2015_266]|nr:hypothetical protein [Oscillatoriaceae cyanobacterium M7585_C2015_266]